MLVVAAHRDGNYTDVERDMAAAALMKLFHVPNPEARAMRDQAEEFLFAGARSFVFFASAAKELDREDQETLITQLWRVVGSDGEELSENLLMSSIRDFLGFTRAQADALKPAAH
nr:TerB family tellurite resistance protein [Parvularcula mediterranea]